MILHDLSEEEMYFYALFMDESGIDQAEFCLIDDTTKVDVIDEETGEPVLDHDGNVKQVDGDGVFRCWPVQQFWWRTRGNKILSQGSRSVGKSLSIKLKTFAFPFVAPGAEMVLTAPEGAHLDALTNNVETLFIKNKIAESMLAKDQRGRIKHRPFQVNFQNGGYILARLPKFDGSGIRGTHPLYLEQDEGCLASDTLILTKRGYVPIKDVNIGDMVLTHKNRWRSVTNVINNGLKKTVTVKGQGHYGLRVTENHKFFAQEVLDYNDRKNKWGVKEKSEFKWLRADQMDGNLWSTPASIPDIEIPNNVEKSKTTSLSYSIEIQSNAFLWCLGLYVAEGSTSSSYGTGGKLNKSTWSIHVDEVDEVTNWMDKAGIKYFVQPVQSTSNCMNVVVAHINLAPWLSEQCGSGCYNKKIPLWIFSLPDDKRQSFYDGLVFGDGCNVKDDRYAEGQHALSTTSKSLAFLFRTLAHSLGRKTAITYTDAGIVSQIRDRYFTSGESFDVRSRVNGQGFYEDNLILHKVKSVTENSDEEEVWDITVEEDESFIAEGIVVHNSFYPEPGWKEIIETVKAGDSRARWRCHGVTVGPGNTFDDKISGKDSTWKVLRLPAMYRPTWTDKERHDKEIEYGGADSPDYRRNVLGLSANSGTPLLVMHRLMEAADTDEMSAYNLEEYYKCVINDAQIREVDSILDLFDPPISHTKYGKVWIGMDYGLTTSNSCIVIFAEVKEKGDDHGRLKLISKVTLTRVSTEDQVTLIKHIMQIYRPTAFAFDAHGIGQPAYDWIQKEVREDPEISWMLDRIKGYSFSKKMIVQFDPNIPISEDDPDGWKVAAIEKLGSEASIDALRLMVDTQRFRLPYDKDLLGELQAVQRKEPVRLDEYGKAKRKQGQHTLDAIRFALLAYNQHGIEEIVNSYEDTWEATEMIIMDYV